VEQGEQAALGWAQLTRGIDPCAAEITAGTSHKVFSAPLCEDF
jgi:hypothetical protein